MAEGVDYSFSRPSAAGLAAAGKRFAGRYVGPGSGKFLSVAERDALFAAGLDIFLLAEGSADSAAGGYPVGVTHAQLARDHARRLGAPDSAAIYFAVDYDVVKGGWDAPREYLRGAGSVLGPARVGVYGERDVMAWAQRDRVAAWFFQTYAWSAGQWFGGNHVEQYHNGVVVAGGEVDLCRSTAANFGQWRADGANPDQVFPPFPSQQGAPDMVIIYDDAGQKFLFAAPFRLYIDDPGWETELAELGIQTKKVANVTAYGVEFSKAEWFALKGIVAGLPAQIDAIPGSGGGSGPSHDELVQAAFEGAQRAEGE